MLFEMMEQISRFTVRLISCSSPSATGHMMARSHEEIHSAKWLENENVQLADEHGPTLHDQKTSPTINTTKTTPTEKNQLAKTR